MALDWSSVFSFFNVLQISRAVSGSDVRHIRLPGNLNFKDPQRIPRNGRSSSGTIFSTQDLQTEAPTSTTASIINAGLNKAWSTEPKAPIVVCPSGPVSRGPSISLQQTTNGKQREQDTVYASSREPIIALPPAAPIPTRLPCLKVSQVDSADPQPGSVSPSASFFQTLERDILHPLKPVETFDRVPLPTIAPIHTHFPSAAQISRLEREPFTPADFRHHSGSRFLSFSLQKAANREPGFNSLRFPATKQRPEQGIIPNPIPQLVPLPSMEASDPEFSLNDISLKPDTVSSVSPAAKGLENTQQNVGFNLVAAGQDSFCSPSVSSSQTTPFNPLLNTFPPAQSLLFLSPSSCPKKRFNFNPFSPEEDIASLPPSPESRSQNDITYPDQSPDYISTNTVPSPPSPTQVPHSPPFPKQNSTVPSPLPIALLLSPWPIAPPPNELSIKIGGLEGYMNYRPRVAHFLLSRANEVENSLVVVWQPSHVDNGGAKGLMSLKALFTQLDEKVLNSKRTALSSFSKFSITIPDLIKDITPYNDLLKPVKEDDGIDLSNAVDLLEFSWQGDFVIFATKFKSLSFTTLAVLDLKSSHISIEDTVALLHSCLDLRSASLGTIQYEEDCEAVFLFKPCHMKQIALPKLSRLTLESNVALHPLIRRILWSTEVSLTLTLSKQATDKIHRLPLPWDLFSNIELNCHLTAQELFNLKKVFPAVKYYDTAT